MFKRKQQKAQKISKEINHTYFTVTNGTSAILSVEKN